MKKKNKHEIDQRNNGKASRNDLIRTTSHNKMYTTYKNHSALQITVSYRIRKKQNEHRNQLRSGAGLHFPWRGWFLSKHRLTNAGTVKFPRI